MHNQLNQIWGSNRHLKAPNTRLFMKKMYFLWENAIFELFLSNKLLFLDVGNEILVLNVNVQSFQSDLGSIMHQQDLKTRFYEKMCFI